MKTKQTPRYRWLFYERRTAADVDSYGGVDETINLVTSGLFAYERAKRPIEIIDAAATAAETQYVLIGKYSRHYHTAITVNLFAWCPALSKLVEILAPPIDDMGDQKKLVIYVMDNVNRDLDTSTLPTS